MRAIYGGLGRARKYLRDQLRDQNRQDNLILLIGALAVAGIGTIAFFLGLPA